MKDFEIEVKGVKYRINERDILNLARYGACHLYNMEMKKYVEDKNENKDFSFSGEFHREIYKHLKKMLKEEN